MLSDHLLTAAAEPLAWQGASWSGYLLTAVGLLGASAIIVGLLRRRQQGSFTAFGRTPGGVATAVLCASLAWGGVLNLVRAGTDLTGGSVTATSQEFSDPETADDTVAAGPVRLGSFQYEGMELALSLDPSMVSLETNPQCPGGVIAADRAALRIPIRISNLMRQHAAIVPTDLTLYLIGRDMYAYPPTFSHDTKGPKVNGIQLSGGYTASARDCTDAQGLQPWGRLDPNRYYEVFMQPPVTLPLNANLGDYYVMLCRREPYSFLNRNLKPGDFLGAAALTGAPVERPRRKICQSELHDVAF